MFFSFMTAALLTGAHFAKLDESIVSIAQELITSAFLLVLSILAIAIKKALSLRRGELKCMPWYIAKYSNDGLNRGLLDRM